MPENRQPVAEEEQVFPEDLWEPEDYPSATTACPDAETIGALIEGTLPAEERAEVEEHIASCARCYEGYATAVTFLAEESRGEADIPEAGGSVSPFPPAQPKPYPSRRWFPLAAALVVGVVGLQAWRLAQPAQAVERFATSIGNPAMARPEIYALPVHRGPDDPAYEEEDRRLISFQAGATLVDFELALTDTARITRESRLPDIAGDLNTILQNAGFHSQRIDLLDRIEVLQDGATVKPRERQELRELAEDVAGSPLLNSRFLELGAWAEAGRLAARSGQPGFFQGFNGWRNRRFLDKALKLPDLMEEDDRQSLLEIQRFWPKEAGSTPGKELDRAFSSLVETYGIDAGVPLFDELDPLVSPTPSPQPGK